MPNPTFPSGTIVDPNAKHTSKRNTGYRSARRGVLQKTGVPEVAPRAPFGANLRVLNIYQDADNIIGAYKDPHGTLMLQVTSLVGYMNACFGAYDDLTPNKQRTIADGICERSVHLEQSVGVDFSTENNVQLHRAIDAIYILPDSDVNGSFRNPRMDQHSQPIPDYRAEAEEQEQDAPAGETQDSPPAETS